MRYRVNILLIGFILITLVVADYNITLMSNDSNLSFFGAKWEDIPSLCMDAEAKYTNTPGGFVVFPFAGTAVYAFASSGNSSGLARITLDGDQSVMDLHWSGENHSPCRNIYSYTGLHYTQHTLTIMNAGPSPPAPDGQALFIDYFIVTRPDGSLDPGTPPMSTTSAGSSDGTDPRSSPSNEGGNSGLTKAEVVGLVLSLVIGAPTVAFGTYTCWLQCTGRKA